MQATLEPTVDHAIEATGSPDECYRCGYALRGIADEQACPECGLLALRSRRPSDELHDTRPRWLRRISLGAALILLALLSVPAWPFALVALNKWARGRFFLGPNWYRVTETAWLYAFELSTLVFLLGVFLLTSAEGYEPADRADRNRRHWLRLAAAAPLTALLIVHVDIELEFMARSVYGWTWSLGETLAFGLGTIGCVPLPLLLFRHFRRLAGRARSAHLAEHCTIVGLGTSATLVYVPGLAFVMSNSAELGLGENWFGRSNAAFVLTLILLVAAFLFPLWSLYLLVRFMIAFRVAAWRLRRKWVSDDRALAITR